MIFPCYLTFYVRQSNISLKRLNFKVPRFIVTLNYGNCNVSGHLIAAFDDEETLKGNM